MLSYFYYLFYFLLCFSSLYFINKQRIFLLYPLLFTAQFNVTCFLKAGVTISFFELNLIFTTVGILVLKSVKGVPFFDKIFFKKQDKAWLMFLVFCFLSIFISILRVNLSDLKPDPDFEPAYYIRGIMSLNKFFFYFPCFYIIRSYLLESCGNQELKSFFIKAMGWSGLLPALAVLIQFSGIGFILIHNNPSFAEIFRVETYTGARPVGLTNEASFFVYQLFFSAMSLYYAWRDNTISKRLFYSLTGIYIFGVILSLSRTGLLIFALFYLMVWMRESKVFTAKGFFKVLKFLPVIFIVIAVLSTLNIGGFNLGERVLSSFKSEADLSTIERYGSSKALYALFFDKSLFFGVGIYNYQYYVKAYIPAEMNMFYYPKGVAPASFNFIFELLVEFGLVISMLFFYYIYLNVFKAKNERFYKDWFLFLCIFSFSFQTLNFAIPFLIFFYPSKIAE